MPTRIRITWDYGEVFARLDDTPGARAVLAALPIRATASTRGGEVYLSAALRIGPDDDGDEPIEPGTVCYWTEGASIALPFGPTQLSRRGAAPRAARCRVLGRLEDDPHLLGRIRDGHLLTVSLADPRSSASVSAPSTLP